MNALKYTLMMFTLWLVLLLLVITKFSLQVGSWDISAWDPSLRELILDKWQGGSLGIALVVTIMDVLILIYKKQSE